MSNDMDPRYYRGLSNWLPEESFMSPFFGTDRAGPVYWNQPKRSVLDKLRASWYALREVWS